jgi:hypothetical protein
MGAWFKFACSSCGYTAEVSGGRDVGMVAVVQTSTCTRCRDLVDVIIGYWGTDGATGDAEYDRDLGKCPKCDGTAVVSWPEGRPCPKCGDPMEQGGTTALWD